MASPLPIITLTTDFGLDSHYVGQLKGAILAVTREVQVVDVSHSVPVQDVSGGAWIIDQSVDAFPNGTIHLAVVDPGVGSDRSMLCAKTRIGYFVAPNNGLLTRVFDRYVPEEVVQLSVADFWRSPVSSTFHGRDIMGPVAAHVSLGVSLAALGPPLEELHRIAIHPPVQGRDLVGQVEYVDSFGNLITNIGLPDLETFSDQHARSGQLGEFHVAVESYELPRISRCYADAEDGQLLALVGSGGMLEIAVTGGSAAEQCGLRTGAKVLVRLPSCEN